MSAKSRIRKHEEYCEERHTRINKKLNSLKRGQKYLRHELHVIVLILIGIAIVTWTTS